VDLKKSLPEGRLKPERSRRKTAGCRGGNLAGYGAYAPGQSGASMVPRGSGYWNYSREGGKKLLDGGPRMVYGLITTNYMRADRARQLAAFFMP